MNIKLKNILVEKWSVGRINVYLTDFGISRTVEDILDTEI
jgi:serine/threonine protein kinase